MTAKDTKEFAAKVAGVADDPAAVAKLTSEYKRKYPNDEAVKALCDRYARAADAEAIRAISTEVADQAV